MSVRISTPLPLSTSADVFFDVHLSIVDIVMPADGHGLDMRNFPDNHFRRRYKFLAQMSMSYN